MKRLVPVVAALVLAAPASAPAKSLVSLTLCGTNGCHTTRDKHELADAMQQVAQADPGQKGPWFKLRQAIGEPGQRGAVARIDVIWTPSIGVVRSDEGSASYFWQPVASTKRVLHRLAHGLDAFPAGTLPPLPGDPNAARVEQVVPAPTTPGHAVSDGGSGTSWAWALLALLPAGLVFALRRRRRWI